MELPARNVLLLGVILLQWGCATSKPALSLEHPLIVPANFAVGGGPHSFSPAERYVSAYEKGWWSCAEDFSKDIRYKSTESDRIHSGWGEEAGGFAMGYDAAEIEIKELIRAYGETATQKLLIETFNN